MTYHYIELPKFDDKKDIEYMEAVELWLTFMKRIGEPGTEELLNQLMERSETLKMAKEMLEKISADERLREKYYAREKARRDAISRLKYAERKGMEKGIEKGAEKREIEIAEKLINMGLPLGKIMEATGLTEKEIREIESKQN